MNEVMRLRGEIARELERVRGCITALEEHGNKCAHLVRVSAYELPKGTVALRNMYRTSERVDDYIDAAVEKAKHAARCLQMCLDTLDATQAGKGE